MITAFIHLIRDYLPISQDQPISFPIQTFGNSFSVMHWNCLCSKYSTQKSFPTKNLDILEWNYRSKIIKQYISSYQADIICLNEIDQNNFFIFLEKDYEIYWEPKNHNDQIKEGIYIAIKKSKFKVIKQQIQHYIDDKGQEMTQFFQFVRLQHIETNQEFWLIATHLKSKEEFEKRRVLSIQFLIEFLKEQFDQAENKKIPILICGDLNTEPNSETIKKLQELQLFDSTFNDQEFTTYKVRESTYKRVIDYHFFSKNHIKLVARANLPSSQEVNSTGFPSQTMPSDHLFLYAIYQFI